MMYLIARESSLALAGGVCLLTKDNSSVSNVWARSGGRVRESDGCWWLCVGEWIGVGAER